MKTKETTRFLFVGGHLTPALAVLEELQDRGYTNFFWIGHKYTMLQDTEPSQEYKQLTQKEIPFYNLKTGKFYRYFSLLGIISLCRIPFGFIQAFLLVLKIRPTIAISFGGYLAVPVAFSCFILRIPVITHEQTATVGLANQFIGRIAKKVLVTWSVSQKYFDKDKVIRTGNPVRKEIYAEDHVYFDFQNDLPTLLIVGGNQGSHMLNLLIRKNMPTLSKQFNIIHQTGSNTVFNDFDTLIQLTETYSTYKVAKGIWGEDMGRAFHQADIVICRSGANTIYELALLEKVSILVPLPYAVHNEQYENAKILEAAEIGFILEEKNVTDLFFLETLHKALIRVQEIQTDPEKAERIHDQIQTLVFGDATRKIADVIESQL